MTFTIEFLNNIGSSSGVLLGFLIAGCLSIFIEILKDQIKIFCKMNRLRKQEKTINFGFAINVKTIFLLILIVIFSILTLKLMKTPLYAMDTLSSLTEIEFNNKQVKNGGLVWSQEAIDFFNLTWETYKTAIDVLRWFVIIVFIGLSILLFISPIFCRLWLCKKEKIMCRSDACIKEKNKKADD